MSFDSFTDLLAMGGHGLYVWLSYGAALVVALVNVLTVRAGRTRQLRYLTDRLRRRGAEGAGATTEEQA